jgi:hypothetical protein
MVGSIQEGPRKQLAIQDMHAFLVLGNESAHESVPMAGPDLCVIRLIELYIGQISPSITS